MAVYLVPETITCLSCCRTAHAAQEAPERVVGGGLRGDRLSVGGRLVLSLLALPGGRSAVKVWQSTLFVVANALFLKRTKLAGIKSARLLSVAAAGGQASSRVSG